MKEPSDRTGSTGGPDASVGEVLRRAEELTVPDRAELAVGLVGRLAAQLDRGQMVELIDRLQDEADRGRGSIDRMAGDPPSHAGVGQGGRGEFRARELL